MARCQRCEGERVHWFTPKRFGREQGVFLCLTCGKVNVYYAFTHTTGRATREQRTEETRHLASVAGR